jgi:predicted Zn-dependent peptidase
MSTLSIGARVAMLCAAALLGLTAAVPAQPQRFPTAVQTDLGGVSLISESDDDETVAGVQVFLAAGLDRQLPSESGIAALVADCITRTPVNGVAVRDAIAQSGGSLDFTVEGRSVHFYIESVPQMLPAQVELFAKALSAPDFSPQTIAAARSALTARINDLEGNALSVAVEMFRRSYFATSAGLPALGSTTAIAALSSKDLAAFYQANYRRSGLSASAAGDLTPGLADALKTLAAGLPEGVVTPVVPKAKPIPENAPRIVSNRDVAAPIVVVGYAAPPPGSADFGAMLVLESLLSNAFERSSATTLGIAERSVGAFYLYDSSPASLVVYVNGTRVDPSIALRELLVAAKSLSLKPLDAEALKHFKIVAEGQFLTGSLMVADRAYLLGTFAAQGLGSDAINAALAALDKTTAADVQRVAKTYLQRYIVALVLPRQNGGS